MKIIGRESFTVVVLTAAFSQINAASNVAESTTSSSDEVPVPITAEEECIPIHKQLKKMGSSVFSEMLDERGLDFKYGQFTIFAPSDKLLENEESVLTSAGYSEETINDVLLFHVSVEGIQGDIKDHCNMTLSMLNEELHVNQESSVTECSGGRVYQVGPGNAESGLKPRVFSDAIQACDGIIYPIKNALMLPTLPNATKPVSPTPKPSGTVPIIPTASPAPPTRQDPPSATVLTPAPTQASSSAGSRFLLSSHSLVLTVSAVIVLSFF